MKRVQVPLWAVILVSLFLVLLFRPNLIRFWPFTVGQFIELITPLFLVALFIERALEVFLTAWRGKGSAKITQEIEQCGARLEQQEQGARTKMDDAQKKI